jgi:ribonuclease BN (tRNA processing enzyme)
MRPTDAPLSRRSLLAGMAAAPALTTLPALAQNAVPPERSVATLKNAKGTRLVLLGTFGGPGPGRAMHSTSHVMLSGGEAYILDCGLGVTNQFARAGIPFTAVKSIFITHHHADHNAEYGPFLLIGWIRGLKQSVKAYGPPPLKFMSDSFINGYKQTFDFWAQDMNMTALKPIEVHEVTGAGPVMQDDKVAVRSAVVNHPPVVPAFAYRFDFKDRSIAFSGDTAPTHAVSELAKGADVLVHEATFMDEIEKSARAQVAAGRPLDLDAYLKHQRESHTDPVDVGRIAQEAGVRTLVLSHLGGAAANIPDERWGEAAARHFKGEIILGKDLMVI